MPCGCVCRKEKVSKRRVKTHGVNHMYRMTSVKGKQLDQSLTGVEFCGGHLEVYLHCAGVDSRFHAIIPAPLLLTANFKTADYTRLHTKKFLLKVGLENFSFRRKHTHSTFTQHLYIASHVHPEVDLHHFNSQQWL